MKKTPAASLPASGSVRSRKEPLLYGGLAAASAVLMSLPYLLPGCGFIMLFALLPLLALERVMYLGKARGFFLYAWLGFSLWNFITTFWVCNATLGGGIFTGFANAFKMALIFQLFHWSRRHLRGILPWLFLASMWIAWEKIYFDSPIPWPWLIFGNAFAGSIHLVQWYEFTGTLGGSLWVWASNLGLFGLMTAFSDGRWFTRFNAKARVASVTALVLTLTGPMLLSAVLWFAWRPQEEGSLDVLISQPDFDPYMKFELYSQREQNAVLEEQMRTSLGASRSDAVPALLADTAARSALPAVPAGSPLADAAPPCAPLAPTLILAPETFTSSLWLPEPREDATVRHFASVLEDYPGATLLMGASTYEWIESEGRPSDTARRLRDGLWYESHNSALSFNAGARRLDMYHKSRLVPATESTPFPSILGRFDDEVLGGVLARCVGQDEPSLLYCYAPEVPPADSVRKTAASDSVSWTAAADSLQRRKDIPLAPVICYESIFGDYCRGYVQKGAQALCIITNDAWWGNTPGYRQHLDYARLRAVETRRDIARSANTGISAFINQRGEITARTHWWTREVLQGRLALSTRQTFFVRHGDITGRAATFLFLLLLALWLVRLFAR